MSRSMGKGTTPRIFCALPRKSIWKRFRCTVSSCGALHSANKDPHTLPHSRQAKTQLMFTPPLGPIGWCQFCTSRSAGRKHFGSPLEL